MPVRLIGVPSHRHWTSIRNPHGMEFLAVEVLHERVKVHRARAKGPCRAIAHECAGHWIGLRDGPIDLRLFGIPLTGAMGDSGPHIVAPRRHKLLKCVIPASRRATTKWHAHHHAAVFLNQIPAIEFHVSSHHRIAVLPWNIGGHAKRGLSNPLSSKFAQPLLFITRRSVGLHRPDHHGVSRVVVLVLGDCKQSRCKETCDTNRNERSTHGVSPLIPMLRTRQRTT